MISRKESNVTDYCRWFLCNRKMEEKDNDDDTFQAVEASLMAAREAKAAQQMEEKQKEEEAFQAVEATLAAQREAHAKRIAAENSKKRKVATVTTKRPSFVTSSASKGQSRWSICCYEDDAGAHVFYECMCHRVNQPNSKLFSRQRRMTRKNRGRRRNKHARAFKVSLFFYSRKALADGC